MYTDTNGGTSPASGGGGDRDECWAAIEMGVVEWLADAVAMADLADGARGIWR